jgi:hypothetical protein
MTASDQSTPKRKRGGQKGNQNALKYGFYSFLEKNEFEKRINPRLLGSALRCRSPAPKRRSPSPLPSSPALFRSSKKVNSKNEPFPSSQKTFSVAAPQLSLC